jgi:flagellar hook-length control protein FliK
MTTVNAVTAIPAASTPNPAVAIERAGGPSFESALNQALGGGQTAANQAASQTSAPAPAGGTTQGGPVAVAAPAVPAKVATANQTTGAAEAKADQTAGPDLGGPCALTDDAPSVTTDDTAVELPQEAIAAFVASFIAMAAQVVPTTGDAQDTTAATAAAGVNGAAADIKSLAALFAEIQTVHPSQQSGASFADTLAQVVGPDASGKLAGEVEKLLDTLINPAEHSPQGTQGGGDALDALLELVQPTSEVEESADQQLASILHRIADQLGQDQQTSTAGITAAEFAQAVQQLGAAVQVSDVKSEDTSIQSVSQAPTIQVADTAAQIARALAATSAPVSGTDQSSSGSTLEKLADAVATAKAIGTMAEAGQQLHLSQVSGSSHVTVQLHPESLGTVQVEVVRTTEGVTAKVTASTAAGRQAIEQNAAAIEDALRAAGVAVSKVEVKGPASATTPSFQVAVDAASSGASQPAAQAQAAQPVEATSASETQRVSQAQGSAPVEQAHGTERASQAREGDSEPVEAPSATEAGDAATTAPTTPAPQVASASTVRVDPSAQSAPTHRTEAVELVRDIAQQIALLGGQEGKSNFQLQLNPEALGRLHVRLSLEDGAMTVRMTAQSSEARSAIEQNVGQLRQALQDQGIRVDRFEVVASQPQFGQDNQHPRRSRGWVDQVRSSRSNADEGDFAKTLAAVGATRSFDYRA